MSTALLLRVVLVCVSAAGVSADGISTCDPAITSKLPELYPNGVPENLIASMIPNGLYSYVVVSSDEATKFFTKAKCLGITLKSPEYATASYKFPMTPTFNIGFSVTQTEPGVISQTDGQKFKFYVLCFDDGVVLTYRCCETCTGSGPNTGIAVADKKKNNPATIAGLARCKKVMADMGLDKDTVTLSNCT